MLDAGHHLNLEPAPSRCAAIVHTISVKGMTMPTKKTTAPSANEPPVGAVYTMFVCSALMWNSTSAHSDCRSYAR